MQPLAIVLAWSLLLVSVAQGEETKPGAATVGAGLREAEPPIAKIVPREFERHGVRWTDNYYWMVDRHGADLAAYLKAENAYATARLARLERLIDTVEIELHARTDGDHVSAEVVDDGYVYRRRFVEGARFASVVRRKNEPGAPEQMVLDVESLASGHRQYELNNHTVSPDNDIVAFAVDFTGGRQHRIFWRNIETGVVVDTGIENAGSDLVFAADSRTLFYTRTEPGTVRAHQLWRHTLGRPSSEDVLLYEEPDTTFEVSVSRSKSDRYILLRSEHQNTSEVRYVSADRPDEPFRMIEPRRKGVAYAVDHVVDSFYIRTNLNAPDFRLVRAPESAPQAANWVDLLPETPGRHIAFFSVFDTFLAIVEDNESGRAVRVFNRADMREMPVPRPQALGVMDMFVADGAANNDAAATTLQVRFNAPTHPQAIYEFDTRTGSLTLKEQALASRWFDTDGYEVKRISATAPDGESVPITIMYRKDMLRAGGNPTLVVGYGGYGWGQHPTFPDGWFSLIDRGFVYALAHVRGGREKGQRWHDQGRMLNKMNSFTDFIAVTEALIEQGIADRRLVFSQGGSAGGLLVGAAMNLRPELYAGVVAEVPFVDVLTSTSDPSLPLIAQELEEWGNPVFKDQFDAIRTYSPYDNVKAQAYPPLFVTAGLHDSQVGVQEPAKWVARLRALKTDRNELLFLTNMEAGHQGFSGRFGSIEERARISAWLLDRAGMKE
jgi:oligopeptidase B